MQAEAQPSFRASPTGMVAGKYELTDQPCEQLSSVVLHVSVGGTPNRGAAIDDYINR